MGNCCNSDMTLVYVVNNFNCYIKSFYGTEVTKKKKKFRVATIWDVMYPDRINKTCH